MEGLGSVVAGLLGSPVGTASSFPNVGTMSLIQVCGQNGEAVLKVQEREGNAFTD